MLNHVIIAPDLRFSHKSAEAAFSGVVKLVGSFIEISDTEYCMNFTYSVNIFEKIEQRKGMNQIRPV